MSVYNGLVNLQFDGTSLNGFNCYIFRKETDKAPAREQEEIPVSGRSGSLLIDRKKYPNVTMTYTFTFFSESDFSDCKNFLLSKTGYKILTDSEHSDEFYKAYVSEDIVPVFSYDRKMIKAEVTFTRKPQRYLTSGENPHTYHSGDTLENPTLFASQPLIRVYGWGDANVVLTVNDISVQTIRDGGINPWIEIDSELMDAYSLIDGAYVNWNSEIRLLSDYKFPVFRPGTNTITIQSPQGAQNHSMLITPRWYRL